MTDELTWVSQSCTLPTSQRPLRVAEFDELFATALRGVQRRTATSLQLMLDLDAEEQARELTARETECCSFFTFTVGRGDDAVHLDVEVPPAHAPVLDALAERAATARRAP